MYLVVLNLGLLGPKEARKRRYGPSNPLYHEGLRSGGCQPSYDLQLDFRWQGRIRADRRRCDPDFRRLTVARTGRSCSPRRSQLTTDNGVARVNVSASASDFGADSPELSAELRVLFHRLNNQLGVILAYTELLEVKAVDEASRSRAAEVIAKILDAMATAKEIRQHAASNVA